MKTNDRYLTIDNYTLISEHRKHWQCTAIPYVHFIWSTGGNHGGTLNQGWCAQYIAPGIIAYSQYHRTLTECFRAYVASPILI